MNSTSINSSDEQSPLLPSSSVTSTEPRLPSLQEGISSLENLSTPDYSNLECYTPILSQSPSLPARTAYALLVLLQLHKNASIPILNVSDPCQAVRLDKKRQSERTSLSNHILSVWNTFLSECPNAEDLGTLLWISFPTSPGSDKCSRGGFSNDCINFDPLPISYIHGLLFQ